MIVRIKPILIAVVLIAAAASPAPAGSLGSTEVGPSLEWTSRCTPPVAPSPTFHDIAGYNAALEAYNTYVARVRNYIQCVQSDGKKDIDTLAAEIAKRMQEEQTAAANQAEKLRSDLDVQRSVLH